MGLRERLQRLERQAEAAERQRIQALIETTAGACGISADTMLAGMRRWLLMSEAEQRAFLPGFYAGLSADDAAELPALLAHHRKMLCEASGE